MQFTSRKFKGSSEFLRNSRDQDRSAKIGGNVSVPTVATADGNAADVETAATEQLSETILTGLASHKIMAPAAISAMIGASPDVTQPMLDTFIANNMIEDVGGNGAPKFKLTAIGERAVRYFKMVK